MKSAETDFATSGLFALLTALRPHRVVLSVIIGTLGGVGYALVIPLVLMSIKVEDNTFLITRSDAAPMIGNMEIVQPGLAASFFALCSFILAARTASQILFNQAIVLSTSHLRRLICERIGRVPIQKLETIGQPALVAALTSDVPRIASGAAVLPQVMFSLTSLLGILSFLVIINVEVFVWVASVILLCVLSYRLPLYFGQRYLTRARDVFDRIQEGIEGLILGAKELKLNRSRRAQFAHEHLHLNEEELTRLQMRGNAIMLASSNYGNLVSFFAIGLFVYLFAHHYSLPHDNVVGVVMAMLYAASPIAAITTSITPYMNAKVSLSRLKHLYTQMSQELPSAEEVREPSWLTLRSVVHRYDSADAFVVGPVDLTFAAGEITYLIGGNGSGKSTLAKIISCHYRPSDGCVLLGDIAVSDANVEAARQYISAVYSDFYLFTRLFGISAAQREQAGDYLQRLGLLDKVTISDAGFSTLALSDGQRKRLALLVAILEDRKVYVFDEWAADQDPEFKGFFYEEILPGLRRQRKIVVVVTHDDKYFDKADQLIKMERGKVVSISHRAPSESTQIVPAT